MFNCVECQVYNKPDRPGITRVNKTVKKLKQNRAKKCVFSRRLKVSVQSVLLGDSGREFHVDGPATLNALSPKG